METDQQKTLLQANENVKLFIKIKYINVPENINETSIQILLTCNILKK